MSMLVVPFSFISNANVPVSSMPGWMQPFAANQPVSVVINAVRSLMQGGTDVVGIGHSTGYWVALSLVWCAGILMVFGALATARFSRSEEHTSELQSLMRTSFAAFFLKKKLELTV